VKSIDEIKRAKGVQKLVVLTAYDALFARLMVDSVDMILVGDSLSMSFGGQADTLGITMDEMIYHAKAVRRGAPKSFVIFDMPFGSESSVELAISNGVRAYKEAFCDAVKLEGGAEKAYIVEALVQNKIAVMGHIGLMPQAVRKDGGYKVQGRDEVAIAKLVADAVALERAGAFAIVVEGVKAEAAKAITDAIKIPTIGIGAGAHTDGQVLVFSDMLGLFEEFTPKFVRKYFDGASLAKEVFTAFANDVRNGVFPSQKESY
jgi:3-methyl-2-oxobutanoate hydroxymethyltransferase